jgi:hypothetical protein
MTIYRLLKFSPIFIFQEVFDDFDKLVTADFDNMMDRPIIGTKLLTKCVIVFDVPESPCVINYGFILKGGGNAWFDNVSFEIVSSADSP